MILYLYIIDNRYYREDSDQYYGKVLLLFNKLTSNYIITYNL